jgi:hypothetical protein
MSAKSFVIGLSKTDKVDYEDVVGYIHIDENIVFIYAGDDVKISMPVGELMDFIKSEVMHE